MNTTNGQLYREWIGLVLLVLACSFFANLISSVFLGDISMQERIPEILSAANNSELQSMRWLMILVHALNFILPSFLFVYFFRARDFHHFFLFDGPENPQLFFWLPLVALGMLPVLGILSYFNTLVPLPEHVVSLDNNLTDMVKGFMRMESGMDYLQNILLIAIIPAIGEELLFRGILQRLLGELYHNKHVAVILGAAMFSLFHLQFTGFLPRMALGMLFGYAYIYTRSIWVPIALHFLNNGLMVTLIYFYPEQLR